MPQFHSTVCRTLLSGGLALLIATPGVTAPLEDGVVQTRIANAIADIRSRDGQYNAVIAIDPEAPQVARQLDLQRKAPGALHGEPILLKDNIESRSQATTAGSLALASNTTGRDAPLVAQLRRAGAVILGKANLSEWANFRSEHSSSGWSAVGGQTRNAHDRTRTPCGSSSGSAVAVALGYVDVAIGTETSGSVVCPAAINGVVGFKPTQGLVSGVGIVPIASTQDTAGPIANSVRLASRTLAVMTNETAQDSQTIRQGLFALDAVSTLKGLRVGVFARTQGYDTRRDAELEKVLHLLKSNGVELIPNLDIKPYEAYGKESYDVLLYEFRRDLNAYFATLPNALSAMTLASLIAFNEDHARDELRHFDQSIFLKALKLPDTEEEYRQKRLATQKAMREDGLDRLFAEHELDAIVGITVGPAWMIDWVNGDGWFGSGMAGQAAVAGNPHITLPLGQIAGLPLGISLVGERWKDHKLAALAAQLEAAHKLP